MNIFNLEELSEHQRDFVLSVKPVKNSLKSISLAVIFITLDFFGCSLVMAKAFYSHFFLRLSGTNLMKN